MSLINGPCSFMKKHTHSIISGIEKQWQFGSFRYAGDSTPTLISKNGIQQDTPHPPTQIGLFVILPWHQCSYFVAQVFFLEQTPGYNADMSCQKSLCVWSEAAVSPPSRQHQCYVCHKCLHLKMMINNTGKKVHWKRNELSSMRLIKLQWIHNFQCLIDWTKKMLQMSDLLLDEAPCDLHHKVSAAAHSHGHTYSHFQEGIDCSHSYDNQYFSRWSQCVDPLN